MRDTEFGRCTSCGRPLTQDEVTYMPHRWCEPCEAGGWSIHDFWRSALEAMKVEQGECNGK